MAEAYVSAAAGRIPVVVQVGHNSLREARELASHAQKIGAAAVAMVPPCYIKPDCIMTMIDCMAWNLTNLFSFSIRMNTSPVIHPAR